MINYVGSKLKLKDFILPECPINPDYWIEPFGGMMSFYFDLDLKDYKNTKFVYNDINKLNSDLFISLKDGNFIKKFKNKKIDYNDYLKSFDLIDSLDIYERSISWFIILTCTSPRNISDKSFIGTETFDFLKSKIHLYEEHIDRLEIYNKDYKDIINQYDKFDNSFFYLDPPYVGYEKYYKNSDFNEHYELSKILNNINSNWVLSYYYFPEMQEWYCNHKIKKKKWKMSTEYLIINNSSLPNR